MSKELKFPVLLVSASNSLEAYIANNQPELVKYLEDYLIGTDIENVIDDFYVFPISQVDGGLNLGNDISGQIEVKASYSFTIRYTTVESVQELGATPVPNNP